MAWKAVLFDMDGVLIDSEEYMAKTGVRALKKYGIAEKVWRKWYEGSIRIG